jgi:alanine racemase
MSSNSPTSFAGGRLTVDLAALSRNYVAIADHVRPVQVAAVVKADAYGLGAELVVETLLSAGCETFFVAHLSEALSLRQKFADCEIIVLNGLPAGAERACADAQCIPVINSLEQLSRWNALGLAWARSLPAALQIDAGMSRLGLSETDVRSVAADPSRLRRVDLRLVMSHLACSDLPDGAETEAQRQRFEMLAALLPTASRSLANSGGAFGPPSLRYEMVRPGIALYGGAARQDRPNPMAAVVRLEASIIQVRTVPVGTGVGYGLTYTSPGERRLVTLSVGYADGWPRCLGNRGAAYVGGVRAPIVGRVSMDSMIIDVTGLNEAAVREGNRVELIGDHQSIDQVAADAGTIAYEILTQLGSRYERTYLEAPRVALEQRAAS